MSKQDSVAHATESFNTPPEKNKWEKVLKETAVAVDTSTEASDVDESSAEPTAEVEQNETEEVVATSEHAELKKALEAAQSQIAQLQEQLQSQELYAKADMQNTERRAALDVQKAKESTGERTIKEFLPLIDSYEKSLEQTTTIEQFQEGTRRILALMHQIFEKLGVKELDPKVGDEFDPHYHEAMATEAVDSAQQAPNTIVRVFQKGYLLHKRLVRPAMVIVSKVEENSN